MTGCQKSKRKTLIAAGCP